MRQIDKGKNNKNMEPMDEFLNLGKKLPYREPAGFFEQISEKTLQQAKLREQKRRKSLVLWRTLTVAASLSALALLGYFMFEPDKPEGKPIVLEKQTVEQPKVENIQALKQPEVAEIKKVEPQQVQEKVAEKGTDTEEFGDVLADLSDDELLQMAAMYKADPFISESEQ